ncbi:hypothetical protein RRG08_006831 [Elysia crispata]|uniref:Uncharacterized protein n=1 Tax=Elysia crispata TaxID=231223 RepID=A0AAE1CN87_9GAST|nr:hypothetical protein RRG08_006831 [Elysia crispata]
MRNWCSYIDLHKLQTLTDLESPMALRHDGRLVHAFYFQSMSVLGRRGPVIRIRESWVLTTARFRGLK